MLRPSVIAVVLVSLLGVSACGDDDDTATTPPATVAAAGDVDRYCALTRRLDTEGQRFFAGLDEDSSEAQFKAAERRSVEHFADEFAELEQVAPREIRADVPKLLAGLYERAGLRPKIEVTEAESSAAEKRVKAYERRNCKA